MGRERGGGSWREERLGGGIIAGEGSALSLGSQPSPQPSPAPRLPDRGRWGHWRLPVSSSEWVHSASSPAAERPDRGSAWGSCNTRSKGTSGAAPEVRRLSTHSPPPACPPLRDGVPDWGAVSGPTWGSASSNVHSQARPTSPSSLPARLSLSQSSGKFRGSPWRLPARGVRSPRPLGRGVGKGSLSRWGSRRPLTSGAPAAEAGGRGGASEPRTQRGSTTAPRAGGLGPGAAAPGRAPGLGRPELPEPPGTRARPRRRPEEHLPRPPMGGDPPAPKLRQRGPPPPAVAPARPLPTWAGVRAGGWRHRAASGARVLGAPRRGGGSPPSSSSSSSGPAGSRQPSSPSRPARPSPRPPGWARPAPGSGEAPAGAGLRRSLRQARGERPESGAGRAGRAAAAPGGRAAPARAPVRALWRQRRGRSAFFLGAIEGFVEERSEEGGRRGWRRCRSRTSVDGGRGVVQRATRVGSGSGVGSPEAASPPPPGRTREPPVPAPGQGSEPKPAKVWEPGHLVALGGGHRGRGCARACGHCRVHTHPGNRVKVDPKSDLVWTRASANANAQPAGARVSGGMGKAARAWGGAGGWSGPRGLALS